MRMLADNPSMDFLRQEAKDLLDVLRETGGKAKLADAQRMLAEEYGHRTWAELKTEVERRREELPAPPDGLADAIAEAFGLGAAVDMAPVRYEYQGRRWCLQTERGRFVVRPVFDWIDDAQAELAVDLQERARAVGVRSPVPVWASDGGLVRRVQDRSWRVEEVLDLGPTPVEPVSPEVARQAGAVLAAIHEVAPGTDRPIEGAWVSPESRPTDAYWQALLDRARSSQVPWVGRIEALMPTIDELSRIGDPPRRDDVVITIRDLGPGEVRFGADGELVVPHWDFAGPMSREWELAGILMGWSSNGSNLDAVSALGAGYRERRGASPGLSMGSFSAHITGWLTWLLHRGWEAADPEPSEERDFAERTLHEVLDAPLSTARLARVLEAGTSSA